MREKPVLVTGSTGYVGGRLIPQLLASGYRVRALGRSKHKIKALHWASHSRLEIAEADVLDYAALKKAVQDCWAAFYLVHSMNPRNKDFAEADRKAARNMSRAAEEGDLEKIIYLGGLGEEQDSLSKHLLSRMEVARILQSGSVPTTFLRAAMILGSGSVSFEILRYLVERLPIMITPQWVRNPVQPIAIRNVLNYLQGCLEHEETLGHTFDIGGPDVLTYQRLMNIYAQEAGYRRRIIIPVPVLTPRLSSYWIKFITPIPSHIAKPLAEGLSNPVVCKENRIRSIIPQELMSCREAVRQSLRRIQNACSDACIQSSGKIRPPECIHLSDAPYAGGTMMKSGYRIGIEASPESVWAPIERIGGQTGWYFADFLWQIRGSLDKLFGGIGLRKTQRTDQDLKKGDEVDFFRVREVHAPYRIKLVAEMLFPGEATLEFVLTPRKYGITELEQVTRSIPRGLGDLIYWYALYPFHQFVFKGMLMGIAKAVGRPIVWGPARFKPEHHDVCSVLPNQF